MRKKKNKSQCDGFFHWWIPPVLTGRALTKWERQNRPQWDQAKLRWRTWIERRRTLARLHKIVAAALYHCSVLCCVIVAKNDSTDGRTSLKTLRNSKTRMDPPFTIVSCHANLLLTLCTLAIPDELEKSVAEGAKNAEQLRDLKQKFGVTRLVP